MEPNAQFGYALVGLGDIDRNGLEGMLMNVSELLLYVILLC